MDKKTLRQKIRNLFSEVESVETKQLDWDPTCGSCSGCCYNKNYYSNTSKIGKYVYVENSCQNTLGEFIDDCQVNEINLSSYTMKELFSLYREIVGLLAVEKKEYEELEKKINEFFKEEIEA